MSFFVICTVAMLGSGLSFFSGFGLGTVLLPAFSLFFPIELAIAMSALVHFLNNLFKLSLVGRSASKRILLRFGVPALFAAFAGAWILSRISTLPPITAYQLFGKVHQVEPVKLAIGLLIGVFAFIELHPSSEKWTVSESYLPIGGLLSGFFGGLSGHQGALRSMFLLRVGLSKEVFIGTGVVIACMIDVSRLAVYGATFKGVLATENIALLGASTASAFVGAFAGNRFLKKMTMATVQKVVAAGLILVAVGLAAGLI